MKHPQWPALPYEAWKDTYETLHMWMQIVGKIRLGRMPWLNHCWQVTLYPTARGLSTGSMPYGDEHFQMNFNFVAHELSVQTSRGERRSIALAPMSVADFYRAVKKKFFRNSLNLCRKIGKKTQINRLAGYLGPFACCCFRQTCKAAGKRVCKYGIFSAAE